MPQLAKSLDFLRTVSANVIGYIRVSSEDQIDSNSLSEQAREIEEWCRKKGYILVAIYFDKGVSGTKLAERDGLLAAIQHCKSSPTFLAPVGQQQVIRQAQEVDAITFFNFDRYSRDLGDSEQVRKDLAKFGKKILSTQQDIDLEDINGVFTFQVMQAVAQLQRGQIVKLLYARRMAKVAAGGWIGGRVPYGKKVEQSRLIELPLDQRNINFVRRLNKWVRNGPGGRCATRRWIASYMNLKMQFYCPLDRDDYDKEIGVALRQDYGPKHTQKTLKERLRPHKHKRGRWTAAMVQGILSKYTDAPRIILDRKARTRSTTRSGATARTEQYPEYSRVG